jgi:hypothetical protein
MWRAPGWVYLLEEDNHIEAQVNSGIAPYPASMEGATMGS